MSTFIITVEIDGDTVREYRVSADSEIEACFTARDHFDDLVHVSTEADDPDREVDLAWTLEQQR